MLNPRGHAGRKEDVVSEENGEARPTRVVLSRLEQRSLEEWLISEWPKIEERRPSKPETVEKYNRGALRSLEQQASSTAGRWRNITVHHLSAAVKAIRKTWPTSTAAEAARRQAGLRRQIAVLAFEIRRIFTILDLVCNEEMLTLPDGPPNPSRRFEGVFPMAKALAEVNGGAVPAVVDVGEGEHEGAVAASSL
jgi:hypothetical protein